MVTSDLPSHTIAPELDDTNAAKALRADALATGEDRSKGAAVTTDIVGVYVAYLIAIGFMPPPPLATKADKEIPNIVIGVEQRDALAKLEGRGKVGS